MSRPLATHDRFAWHRLYEYLGVAIVIATVSSFLAYAATVSLTAIFRIEGVDPVKIATEAFLLVGSLSIFGVFLLLATQT